MSVLSYFDAIISGAQLQHGFQEMTAEHVSLLNGLINLELNNDILMEKMAFDPYIISTFKSFIKAKADIIINHRRLDQEYINGDIVKLIMYPFASGTDYSEQRDDNDYRNLFKQELLYLFKNIRSMTLLTYGRHALSMNLLLSIIKNSMTLEKVRILAYGDSGAFKSWQSYLWETSSVPLIDRFKESNYMIQLKYKIGADNKYHGFVITRR